MAQFGYIIKNISSGELELPSPINRKLLSGKETFIVVSDPALIESNSTIKLFLSQNLISLKTAPVIQPDPISSTLFLIPGPPGPQGAQGPVGPSGTANDTISYSCLASINVNDVVYINGPNSVAVANASSAATMPAIGMVVSKDSPVVANVKLFGLITGLVGLTPNTNYYVATTNGMITNVPPTGAGQVIQKMGVAKNATSLVFDPDPDPIYLP